MDVVKVAYCVPASQELLDEALSMPRLDEILEQAQEADRAFRALPIEEQKRIKAEREAEYEARRCPTCGHHPDDDC